MNHRISVVLIALAALGLPACSTDKIAESVIERQIEAESGGDVDIDLDGGQIRIETEDGTFEMNTNGDGDISITDGDGELIVESDTDGEGGVISSDDGEIQFGSTAELPDGFPTDAIPALGGSLFNSSRFVNEDEVTFTMSYQDTTPIAEVWAAFRSGLEAKGYSPEFESTKSPASSSSSDRCDSRGAS